MRQNSTKTKNRQAKLRRLLRRPRETRVRPRRRTQLRFSPTAWAKLLFLRDRGPTEVGGFGIAPAGDLLCVEDVRLMQQACTAVSVAFDDSSVAEFFDEQVDVGRRPEQFGRIWIHTHPGESAEPSSLDEATFARVFGACEWAVMCIVARGGETYCRLRFATGPGGSFEIPIEIDFTRVFGASSHSSWSVEYATTVRPAEFHSNAVLENGIVGRAMSITAQASPAKRAEFLHHRREPVAHERPL
jgi:proteasome lid subunit RPN8/RPN11